MAKHDNFTADRVADFKCAHGKQQAIFWDGKVPGLGLRVTPSGVKSFIFESRLHGKTIRITIGDLRVWAIGKAQAEAMRLKVLIDQGTDPRQVVADKRSKAEAAQAEAKRKTMTLAEAWAVYVEARRPGWGERHYQDHLSLAKAGGAKRKRGARLTVSAPLASLMPLRLSDLNSTKLAEWLVSETVARPTKAAHAYRLLRAFIRWADEIKEYQGLIEDGCYSTKTVKEAVPKSRAKAGDCLQNEQLPAWFSAVRQGKNPIIAAYLQALLLTGARREEMAALRWGDVDFKWNSLKIGDKIEGSRTIPLTPYLASILDSLPRRNLWVFSSPTAADGKLAEPRIAHNEALGVAGLPHLTLHGLRRSFGTLAEWAEVPAGAVAQIMGHKPTAIAEKHYIRRSLDRLRMWHVKIEESILNQAGIEIPKPNGAGLRIVHTVP